MPLIYITSLKSLANFKNQKDKDEKIPLHDGLRAGVYSVCWQKRRGFY